MYLIRIRCGESRVYSPHAGERGALVGRDLEVEFGDLVVDSGEVEAEVVLEGIAEFVGLEVGDDVFVDEAQEAIGGGEVGKAGDGAGGDVEEGDVGHME